MNSFKFQNISVNQGDALDSYESWESPTVIVSDGPYGIDGFPGDLASPEGLGEWYEPHIQAWARVATYQTTLWFWNTEIGWAVTHPILKKHGWRYKACHIWDKGLGHIAGNVNSRTIRSFPVVTEVCVQYYKKPVLKTDDGELSMKEWLRHEWQRSGLHLSKTNEACGVKDAATRKYFTLSNLWYFPPAGRMEAIADYANRHGRKKGKPYFSLNGKVPLTAGEWEKMRPKFRCPHAYTNVWREPSVNGKERLKNGAKALHLNQKPLRLMRLIIEASSDEGDVVWEPFGGLFTALIAANETKRLGYGAEINSNILEHAEERIKQHFSILELDLQ